MLFGGIPEELGRPIAEVYPDRLHDHVPTERSHGLQTSRHAGRG